MPSESAINRFEKLANRIAKDTYKVGELVGVLNETFSELSSYSEAVLGSNHEYTKNINKATKLVRQASDLLEQSLDVVDASTY